MAHILACTDGSVYADSVYDHAAWAAGRMAASVEILHVIDHHREQADSTNMSGKMAMDQREVLLKQLADLDEQKSKLLKQHGRAVLEAAKDHLVEKGVAEPKLTLRNGHFTETVAEVEVDADMIVIGKRGESADFERMHLGTNLERVVRGSKHPVLVTSRAFKPIERVLIAYDGSATVDKALAHLARGPMLKDLDIILLTAAQDTESTRKGLVSAAAQLENAGARSIRTDVQPGQADHVIIEAVKREQADMLVVGAYGHSRIRHLIVGSTTTELVRSCLVPVLMFR